MVALTERSHLNNSFSEVKQLLNALSLAFQSPDSETASPAIDLFTKMMGKYEPDLHKLVYEWFVELSEDRVESPLSNLCMALGKHSDLTE